MYDVPEAARAAGRSDLYFTVEQGPMGGWPKAGGVSRQPDAIWPQLDVFDFYEGGGPDVSILSFGQVDAAGNVNVSKFGGMMPGCGGFTNIVHGVKNLIFCGTLTTGGLEEKVTQHGLEIVTEGRVKKFVNTVEQITMNAHHTLAGGARISFVTDRGVFSLSPKGLTLTHIVPGVDLERDIAPHVEFEFAISPNLEVLNHQLLMPTTTTKE